MKISIVGYGRIGQLVEQCARERGIEIVSTVDPFHPKATHKSINDDSMAGVDVCVSFTQPDVALQNIMDICKWKKQSVIGTTGWLEHMTEVERTVQENDVGLVYSSNFSIGVNIFFKIIEHAANMMNRFDVYDVMGFESHHNKKKDSPSGTATTISKILLDNIDRKKKVCEDKLDRQIESEEIHFASMRGGNIPGQHAVFFDSEFDTIELKHIARNRLGFATGAIIAAEWIRNKKGLFTESDMMKFILE